MDSHIESRLGRRGIIGKARAGRKSVLVIGLIGRNAAGSSGRSEARSDPVAVNVAMLISLVVVLSELKRSCRLKS